VLARVDSDGLNSALPDRTAFPSVPVPAEVVEDRLVLPAASASAEVVPAAPVVISVAAIAPEAVAEAPVMVPASATTGTVDALDGGWSGLLPGVPGESAAAWVMVAAARRETRGRATAPDPAVRTVAAGGAPNTEQLPAPSASVDSGDVVQALTPVAAVAQVDPITAIVQQVQAVIGGIFGAFSQVINQVVAVVNQVVSAIASIFVPATPDNSAPKATTPAVGVPNSTTGAVTGVVSATDPDGDPLTFTAPANTSKGSVAINSSTGAFTYTPTVAARESAAKTGATAADKSDSFTVTITDGNGGKVDVAVVVPVSPATSTDNSTDQLPLAEFRVSTLLDKFKKMPPDTIEAQLFVSDTGSKKMLVYCSGIADVFDIGNGIYSNLSGSVYSDVSGYIDTWAGEWKPDRIMLVGYSNGGMQMQAYATSGTYAQSVVQVVTFASPVIKLAGEYSATYLPTSKTGTGVSVGTNVLHIQADNDPVIEFSHEDAVDSYRQRGEWITGTISGGYDLDLSFGGPADPLDETTNYRVIYKVPGDYDLPEFPDPARHTPANYDVAANAFDEQARTSPNLIEPDSLRQAIYIMRMVIDGYKGTPVQTAPAQKINWF